MTYKSSGLHPLRVAPCYSYDDFHDLPPTASQEATLSGMDVCAGLQRNLPSLIFFMGRDMRSRSDLPSDLPSDSSDSVISPSPDPITKKNIEAIARLEKRAVLKHTIGERIAGDVTRWAGSVLFIVIHIVWFTLWVVANIGWLPGIAPWDPFPFSFLTLVVSLEAIFLSLLVLMTQNRLTQDADKRAQLDLQINMLAEQESTTTLRMLEKICQHLGIDFEADEERYLAKKTDVSALAKTLEEKLPQ